MRQGDPLSPFLFILAIERLHVLMEAVSDNQMFTRASLPNIGPCWSHLMFGEVLMFIREWS